jgi:hypothetical protein
MVNKVGGALLIKNVVSLLKAADDATARKEFGLALEYLDDAKHQLEQYELVTGQRQGNVVKLQRPVIE